MTTHIALFIPELNEIQVPEGDCVPVPPAYRKAGLARLRSWAVRKGLLPDDVELGQFI
jgi:hypothetical protein